MTFRSLIKFAGAAALAVLCSGVAKAQCHDPWINSGFKQNIGRAPNGTGTSGECNPNLYGGGSWSSQQQLYTYITGSKLCPDPWIGEIYLSGGSRPTALQCNALNYGGGHWTTYGDLSAKIAAYRQGSTASSVSAPAQLKAKNAADLLVGSNLHLYDSNGRDLGLATQFALASPSGIVAAGGGNIVAAGGGNIVAAGGGNIVAAGGGNVVSPGDVIVGGASSLTGYSIQSVGGKKLIKGTIVHGH